MAFRTQKISQMTPKGSDLEATDLIEVSTIESGSYVTRSITGQELIDAIPLPPSGITIGTTAITSGTVGRVLFEGTGNVVQESANLFWDNTNGRLGIGTSSPTQDITVSKTIDGIASISLLNGSGGTTASSRFYLGNTSTQVGKLGANYTTGTILKSGDLFLYNQTVGNITFWNNLSTGNINFTTGSGTTAQVTIASTGNVLINTTTDAGFRLDVNGTARVQGPSGYSMVYDSNGVFNLNGTYARLDLFNQSGSLRARLNCDGPNGTLTLYQNASGYIFLNGAQSGNNSYISTALSIGNQSAANASSILEVSSTTKGFLPPRMTTTQKNAIASPAAGLMVYDTTLNLISVYNGTTWITL